MSPTFFCSGLGSLAAEKCVRCHEKEYFMSKVVVRKKIRIPMIGTWEWTKADYKAPLLFHLSGVKTFLYLDMWDPGSRKRETTWEAIIEFHFDPAPRSLVTGLTTLGKQSVDVAHRIYEYYLKANEQFESLLYTVGKTRSLLPEPSIPFESFFSDDSFHGDNVSFQIDDQPKRVFVPKLSPNRRGIRPLLKRPQLIDKDKWMRMQKAIDAQDFASPEIIELFRIRSRLEWRERKIATMEAAIFAETALRDFVVRVLISRGMSKKKLKDIQNDLSFSILLNALLPMALPKAKAERIQVHIVAVDLLRKIRNDLVHGNISESDIDEDKVRNGIEGTLKIVEIIKSELSN